MRLTEAALAVDEEGIVAVAAVGDGLGRLEGQLVLLTLDVGVEGEARVGRGDALYEGVLARGLRGRVRCGLRVRGRGGRNRTCGLAVLGLLGTQTLELGGRDGRLGGRHLGRGRRRHLALAGELDGEAEGLEGRTLEAGLDGAGVLLDVAPHEARTGRDGEGVVGERGCLAALEHREERGRGALLAEELDDVVPEDLGVGLGLVRGVVLGHV